MSGPIVRKYGFPNFEKIFGDRGLQHGVDDENKNTRMTEPDRSADANARKAETNETEHPPRSQ
jgi:hypothetical protein